ncbi:hypothetical protein FJN13_14565 [Alteromonas mediterranea]|uniref:endonuclease/exonuclease/phosphatase family protein n=1 Tax=Alteromonas mediterranea TaxID=314275 RepID=UPI000C89F2AD|nr:endonuclease/exonuclease/phosphatase family protein [Alteromonas mediterranea]MAG66157.1 hypothetical protein [Pseudomonadales bacterium]QDG35957.1 hypothetical protein FJN13_14565 [Alteromonas mediterranea]|tara:strand:- start:6250 stop:7332 length:1083 start_codon:yes stop_codon:yes gene_type:complete
MINNKASQPIPKPELKLRLNFHTRLISPTKIKDIPKFQNQLLYAHKPLACPRISSLSWKVTARPLFFITFFTLFLTTSALADYKTQILKQDNQSNLIVASYNIKWFQHANQSYEMLAQVISNFDICGIVELKDEKALRSLVGQLNKQSESQRGWGYAFGMRTHRPNGKYYESYGVVWDRDIVELGNGIISNVWDYNEDFRNDPFMVSFDWRGIDFTLILIHTRWSDDSDGTREGEVNAIANYIRYLRGFLPEEDIILAGDFNYSTDKTPIKKMLKKAGLYQLTSDDNTTIGKETLYISSYDHIFATESMMRWIKEKSGHAFDATAFVYGDRTEETMKISKRQLSDHIPVFIELNRDLGVQ